MSSFSTPNINTTITPELLPTALSLAERAEKESESSSFVVRTTHFVIVILLRSWYGCCCCNAYDRTYSHSINKPLILIMMMMMEKKANQKIRRVKEKPLSQQGGEQMKRECAHEAYRYLFIFTTHSFINIMFA